LTADELAAIEQALAENQRLSELYCTGCNYCMQDGLLQADACIECGECEEKCPQHIPIIEQLKETHEALGQ